MQADIVDSAVSAALEEHVDGAEIRIKNELAELNTTVRKLQHELHTLMQLVAANIKYANSGTVYLIVIPECNQSWSTYSLPKPRKSERPVINMLSGQIN